MNVTIPSKASWVSETSIESGMFVLDVRQKLVR